MLSCKVTDKETIEHSCLNENISLGVEFFPKFVVKYVICAYLGIKI